MKKYFAYLSKVHNQLKNYPSVKELVCGGCIKTTSSVYYTTDA